MKKLLLVLLLISAMLCTHVLAEEKYAPGQIIIELSPNVAQLPIGTQSADPSAVSISSTSIKSLNTSYKVNKIERLFEAKTAPSKFIILDGIERPQVPDLSNFYILHMSEGTDLKKAIAHYDQDPNVISASVNHQNELFLTPNDPKFNNFPTYFNQWGLFKINAEEAWNITTGSEDLKVAVIDTGVNYNHEDLAGKVINGFDFVNWDSDPMDDHGHGTHVAGIIGAATNNAKGIAGISWDSKILAVKAINSEGWGYTGTSARAIVYAADNGAKIINMSYGSSYNDPYEKAAVDYAHARGCLLVAAAGNGASDSKIYPAGFDNVIAVASTDIDDRKSNYSNFGSWIDLAAPGGDQSYDPKSRILSTYYSTDNNYVWMMGTSMASPHVAGVAALIKTMRPEYSPDDIEKQLKDTADDISSINPGYADLLGAGRINAYRSSNIHTVFSSIKNGSHVDGVVPITGTASHEAFQNYTLQWAPGTSPKEEDYSSDGMILANEGKVPVEDGLLGTWHSQDKFGPHSLRIRINDWSTLESTIVVSVGSFKILGVAESGPNPFNPAIGERTKIKYVLPDNMEVKLYIFDITATLIYSKTYPAGDPDGGHTGTNIIEWDGSSKFGGTAANGAYLYNLSAGGRKIGKGKIIILK
ncbi:S8 family serine peptidase [Candidatus Margulisiibacteriota bacterium]